MSAAESSEKCDLEAYAEDLLSELIVKFPLKRRPGMLWKRLRVTAGQAFCKPNCICLSSLLLTSKERLRSTLIHEYAHLLAFHRGGQKAANHGAVWKQAMAELGEPPIVRHTYEVERNTRRQSVLLKCKKCGLTFARRRRLPRNRRYLHLDCGGAIECVEVSMLKSTTKPT